MAPVGPRKPEEHAGLALVVQNVLGHDPYNGAVYLFRSKRGDQLKCLVWDQTGLILIYKKLEGGAFAWPKPADGVIRLSPAQFAALFEGVDWRAVRAERRQRPQLAG
ncbi:IS66 family insertion sequence element accessory protein TnpB [Rhodobacter capsulatus]|uniref:IS66 family insertion sequence element accessory protein TnpB n=1 Tax=Rhodobacter capsulatus TaxID=1061 RepID=UPI0004CE0C90|nr:IS66 family insertion sequence element accessory protein TnpB [Rhodobacter capsulatus]